MGLGSHIHTQIELFFISLPNHANKPASLFILFFFFFLADVQEIGKPGNLHSFCSRIVGMVHTIERKILDCCVFMTEQSNETNVQYITVANPLVFQRSYRVMCHPFLLW